MRKNLWLSSLYVWLVMVFLYAPIAVLIIFSFNDSKSRNTWTGFTLRWYEELFHDRVIIQSFIVMLVVAIVSSVIATVLGTLAAIGLNKMNKKLKSVVMTFTYLPMINPEIIESDGEQTGDEGCLSLPGKAGQVTRPNHVKAKFYDLDMNEWEVEGEGLMARCICHELDHLDGHMYTEKVEGGLHDVNYEEPEEE